MSDDEDKGCEPEMDGKQPTGHVGYKRPPKQHQFKKGQSGNPKGRPKRAKPCGVDIGAMLMDPVTVTTPTGKKKVPFAIAYMQQEKKLAMQGDPRSRKNVSNLILKCCSIKKKPDADDHEDYGAIARAKIEDYARRRREERANRGEEPAGPVDDTNGK